MTSQKTTSTPIRQWLAELRDNYTPSYFPVAWKMGITLSILVLAGMLVLGSILANSQMQRMQRQANIYGNIIATQLADSAREPLLAKDQFTLKILVNNLTRDQGLKGAAIFDVHGTLLQKAGKIPSHIAPATGQPPLDWTLKKDAFTTYKVPVVVKGMTAGFVAVTLSQNTIIQARKKVWQTFTTATIIMGLLVIFAAFLVGHWLTRPIQALVQATQAIKTGDLHFRLHERRNDELGDLIDSYNRMASGLLEKRQVESVLSRFVSPSVATQMMRDIDQVKLGGRQTPATVLFADIAGFTSLSEKMSPDQIAHLLNDYFNAISCAANFYRGTIDKYVGDCAMIVFGVPNDDSEHLYHGLCCALMTQSLVKRVNARREKQGLVTVNFRIGINSGEVLAGNLGSNERMQYTVVGDTVNLASRLSNIAAAGEIIVPEPLLDNSDIASRFNFSSGNEIRVRGKRQPVATARLESMHAQLEVLMQQRIDQFMSDQTLPPLSSVEAS